MKCLPNNVKINEEGSLVLVDSRGKKWNLDEIYDIIEEIREEIKEKEDIEFKKFTEKICYTIPVKDRLNTVRDVFCKREKKKQY